LEDREAEEGRPSPHRDAARCCRPSSCGRAAFASLQVAALRTAVVTGASSGIGAALVRTLKARGWHTVGLSRRPSDADEHEECDVADREGVEATARRVLERHPRVDLLINNAGLSARGSFLTAEPDRIEQVVRVNYLGSVWTALAFLPGLAEGTQLVNIVSVAGTVAGGPYSASKHAQLAFSRSLSVELAPRGISVLTVNPGFIETPGFPQRDRFPPLLDRFIPGPQLVVDRLLAAVESGKREIVVPRWYRPAAWVQALAPGTVARVRSRGGGKVLEER
jgi:NAD(P)-dependent dehydrogenase (short-subunit alcohol dehydrogenase family)